jgi:hypothetical protein
MNIGIASPVPPNPTQEELDRDMPTPEDRKVILPGDDTVRLGGGSGLILPFAAAPEPEAPLTWAEYTSWRRTKCPSPPEDLARATLELVGEVGELADLILTEGASTFYGEKKAKLIDECGDIFFCACWALDAWGKNPLVDSDDLEIMRVSEDSQLLLFTAALANNKLEDVMASAIFMSSLFSVISEALRGMQTHVGLTANACKKQVYQKRSQDVDKQIGRIGGALLAVNQILIIANSNVEEALVANRTKLNARYPDGWHSNVGGGIREGGGA